MAQQLPHAGPPAAWYDDPEDPAGFRYWNGSRWTDHRSPRFLDPSMAQAAREAVPGLHVAPVQSAPQKSTPQKSARQASSAQAAGALSSTTVPAANTTAGWPLSRLLAALGAVAIVIGSVAPWATVSASYVSIDVKGTEGDGTFTLIGGIVVAGMVYFRRYLSGIVFALLITLTLIADLTNLEALIEDEGLGMVSVGWGLYLATAGAVVSLVALIVARRRERRRAATTP